MIACITEHFVAAKAPLCPFRAEGELMQAVQWEGADLQQHGEVVQSLQKEFPSLPPGATEGWYLENVLIWKDFLTSSCSWIHTCLRKADKNKDNKMSLKELKNFLKEVNIEVDDYHAKEIFQVTSASR